MDIEFPKYSREETHRDRHAHHNSSLPNDQGRSNYMKRYAFLYDRRAILINLNN